MNGHEYLLLLYRLKSDLYEYETFELLIKTRNKYQI